MAPGGGAHRADGRFRLSAQRGYRYTLTVADAGFAPRQLAMVGGAHVAAVQLVVASTQRVEVTGTGQGTLDADETEGGLAWEAQEIAAIPLMAAAFPMS